MTPAAQLRALAQAATPGPWKARIATWDDPGKEWHGEEYTQGIDLGPDDFIETDGSAYGPNPANARLIALAPDLAALLAETLDVLTEIKYAYALTLTREAEVDDLLARAGSVVNTETTEQ